MDDNAVKTMNMSEAVLSWPVSLSPAGKYEAHKDGRPCCITPRHFPIRTIAQLLLEKGQELNKIFSEEIDHKTAIESMRFNKAVGDGQSHLTSYPSQGRRVKTKTCRRTCQDVEEKAIPVTYDD